MHQLNILVFPCGSEIGLEIFRSLKYSRHIKLFGASSTDDHGKFLYQNYIDDLPFINHPDFISSFKKVIAQYKIDAVYPAMDSVIQLLSKNQYHLPIKIIASPFDTTNTCFSKKLTYELLNGVVKVPKLYSQVEQYPVFCKPAIGYGSRGANKIEDEKELELQIKEYPDSLVMEYLPGKEYTIDCFTDRNRQLLFVGQRERLRIMNGISVNTSTMPTNIHVKEMALAINRKMEFRGAWFFQIKENINGELVLLEVASRLAGSSATYRCKGINFALLSVFDAFDQPVEIFSNSFEVELDRALENKYKINFAFSKVYVDFDDALVINGKLNVDLVKALFQFFSEGKKIILITKHDGDINATLKKFRISLLFDEVIHLKSDQHKAVFIDRDDSIFIDDSFQERKHIHEQLKIPVFAPDAIEALI